MPKLSEALTTLKIDGKTFKNPEWWNSKHKLTRKVKDDILTQELIKKATGKIGGTYRVTTLENQPPADVYVQQMHSLLDAEKYSEFAPWSPVHRKSNVIIINNK